MAYIERETTLKIIDNYEKTVNADGKVIVKAIRDIVDIICPTADVVEVRHGKWEKQQFIGRSGFFSVKDFTCSNCFENFAVEQGKGLMNYCPNCGAKMDGKDGE